MKRGGLVLIMILAPFILVLLLVNSTVSEISNGNLTFSAQTFDLGTNHYIYIQTVNETASFAAKKITVSSSVFELENGYAKIPRGATVFTVDGEVYTYKTHEDEKIRLGSYILLGVVILFAVLYKVGLVDDSVFYFVYTLASIFGIAIFLGIAIFSVTVTLPMNEDIGYANGPSVVVATVFTSKTMQADYGVATLTGLYINSNVLGPVEIIGEYTRGKPVKPVATVSIDAYTESWNTLIYETIYFVKSAPKTILVNGTPYTYIGKVHIGTPKVVMVGKSFYASVSGYDYLLIFGTMIVVLLIFLFF